jgi:hypothetical protein
MNWEAIGAIGEIVGATAVVGTLIYLAVQLRHNTKQMEYSARTTEVASYLEITGRLVQNRQVMFSSAELPTLIEKLRQGEQLDDVETRRYGAYVLSMLANADAAYFQYSKGILSLDRLDSLCQGLLRHLKTHPFGVVQWKIYREEFVSEFRDYLDKKITAIEADDNV